MGGHISGSEERPMRSRAPVELLSLLAHFPKQCVKGGAPDERKNLALSSNLGDVCVRLASQRALGAKLSPRGD
jgi:hypothetical protein